MKDETVDVLCKDCGAAFSAFLREIAEHNGKITCPGCGATHDYVPREQAGHSAGVE
jgi:DNA-directed RNA polymerase subunit RPC12/RpoP